jgi:hypothetical protein
VNRLAFFRESLSRPDIKIVGIAEPDQQLASRYAKRYGLDPSLLFADLEQFTFAYAGTMKVICGHVYLQ